MDYPLEIMPQANYRELTDLGDIIHDTKICLIRRVDGIGTNSSEEDIKHFFGECMASNRSQLNEYSLFIIGGMFEERHLSVTVNVNSVTDDTWSEGNTCQVSDFADRVLNKENFCAVYFFANELHEVDFTKPPSLENQEITSKLTNAIKSPIEVGNGNKSTLKHKPMNFNYWHIQIHFFDAEGNEFPSKAKLKKRHKEALVTFLQSVLINRMRFKAEIMSQCSKIDPSIYMKTS